MKFIILVPLRIVALAIYALMWALNVVVQILVGIEKEFM